MSLSSAPGDAGRAAPARAASGGVGARAGRRRRASRRASAASRRAGRRATERGPRLCSLDEHFHLRPDGGVARPARTLAVDLATEPARLAAIPHDRHDRRRAGAGRPDPGAARRHRVAVPRRWRARSREPSGRAARSIVTGCGTSEHAAQGVAEILREAVAVRGPERPGGIAARGARRRAGVRAVPRPADDAGWSSASPTRARRPRRMPRWPHAEAPERGPR